MANGSCRRWCLLYYGFPSSGSLSFVAFSPASGSLSFVAFSPASGSLSTIWESTPLLSTSNYILLLYFDKINRKSQKINGGAMWSKIILTGFRLFCTPHLALPLYIVLARFPM